MALFNKRNNLLPELPETTQPVKRGRGRPRKIEQTQQGSQPSTEVIQPQRGGVSQKFSGIRKKKLFYILLILILTVVPTIYFYSQNKNTEKKLNNLQQKSDDLNTVLGQVGKLVLLPTGEQPILATVSDLSKIQGQPFFTHAQNGDKVLIYKKTRKAILYRPSINKIIEIAPVNIDNNATSQPPAGQ